MAVVGEERPRGDIGRGHTPGTSQRWSAYLLLAIGLKGGSALAAASPGELVRPVVATLVLGALISGPWRARRGWGSSIPVIVAPFAGLSVGGAAVFGAMAASAYYIAAPATVAVSLPEANLGLALTASLAVTFPFTLAVGIPLYHALASRLG